MNHDKVCASIRYEEAVPSGEDEARSLEVKLESGAAPSAETDVLVLGAFPDGTLPAATQAVDQGSKGWIASLIQRGDLESKARATLLLHDVPGTAAKRVLLVSLGSREKFGEGAFREALRGATRALSSGAAQRACVTLPDVEVGKRSLAWRLQQASVYFGDGAYRFELERARGGNGSKAAKSNGNGNGSHRGIHAVTLLIAGKNRHRSSRPQWSAVGPSPRAWP